MSPRVFFVGILVLLTAMATGCSDSNNNGVAAPAPQPNVMMLSVTLTAAQRTSLSLSPGSAAAEITVDLDTGEISGTVELTNVDATAVVLSEGFAGEMVADVLALDQQDADTWMFAAGAELTAGERDLLMAGALHLRVEAADGGVRGQLLPPGVTLVITFLSGVEQVPPIASNAAGYGFITIDEATATAQVHVRVFGLEAANPVLAMHIHEALAGLNGGILVDGFEEDGNDNGHWFKLGVVVDQALADALAAGRLYFNVHTPDNPPGEVRGQILPDGVEVVFTEMTGGEVVNVAPQLALPTGSATAASTIRADLMTLSMVVNTRDLDTNGAMVAVHQAPEGQNGPVSFALTQDVEELTRHTVVDVALAPDQYAALRNQLLYVELANMDGEIRGQIAPAGSMPPSGETFVVTTTTPENAATLASLPAEVSVAFSSDPLPSTVPDAVFVERSGGDGGFGESNEVVIEPAAIAVVGDTLSVDLTNVPDVEDVYRVTVADTVADISGQRLDGDKDGNAGGDFEFAFTVMEAPVTFTFIQEQIFTPSCANSSCHAPPTNQNQMNLSEGAAFASIVGVPTFDSSDLNRIEPGNPEASYLLKKVRGDMDIVGSRMPLGGAPLDPALVEALSEWIADGAQDN